MTISRKSLSEQIEQSCDSWNSFGERLLSLECEGISLTSQNIASRQAQPRHLSVDLSNCGQAGAPNCWYIRTRPMGYEAKEYASRSTQAKAVFMVAGRPDGSRSVAGRR